MPSSIFFEIQTEKQHNLLTIRSLYFRGIRKEVDIRGSRRHFARGYDRRCVNAAITGRIDTSCSMFVAGSINRPVGPFSSSRSVPTSPRLHLDALSLPRDAWEMLLRWQLLLSRPPLRQSVTGLTLRKAAWRKAQERAVEDEKAPSSTTGRQREREKKRERDRERERGSKVTNEGGGEEWRISWWRRPPVTLLPPSFFAAPSSHRSTASLFGPRPVQDAARIARKG